MTLKVKWVLFDFGGCLDSDGVHSRTLFYNEFQELGLNSSKTEFQEAYSFSDKKVIEESLIVDSHLLEMNQKMCFYIGEFLKISDNNLIDMAAMAITNVQANYLIRNKNILSDFSQHYKLGIISNFSGNLVKILQEFELDSYFTFVLDSYHVGFTKPDPRIFKIALEKCQADSSEIVFIGDNIDRDVFPAKALGINTILISATEANSAADYTLNSVEGLRSVIQKL